MTLPSILMNSSYVFGFRIVDETKNVNSLGFFEFDHKTFKTFTR